MTRRGGSWRRYQRECVPIYTLRVTSALAAYLRKSSLWLSRTWCGLYAWLTWVRGPLHAARATDCWRQPPVQKLRRTDSVSSSSSSSVALGSFASGCCSKLRWSSSKTRRTEAMTPNSCWVAVVKGSKLRESLRQGRLDLYENEVVLYT